jgi:hypothetical protein
MIRSPSQFPGTARSSTSAGRSAILIMLGMRFLRCPTLLLGRRNARPVCADTPPNPAQRAPRHHVEGLVDGLGRHPHLQIVGELQAQPADDLLRRVPLLQIVLDLLPQRQVAHQLGYLGAARPAHTPARAQPSPGTGPADPRCAPAPERSSTRCARAARRSSASTHPPPDHRDLLPLGERQTVALQPSPTPRPNPAGIDPHPPPGTPAGIDHATASVMKPPSAITCQNRCNRSRRMKIEYSATRNTQSVR